MRSKILLVQVVLVVSWSILLFDILAGITFAEWPSDPTVNVPICTAESGQLSPQLVSDGAGGAIITWEDWRSGDLDIYAQRVNASGAVLWTTDGVPICTAADDQSSPKLVSDGAGGAIITWKDWDWRSGSDGIYAQRVDASGRVLWTTDGVPICTAGGQWSPQLVSDGAGGAIITWSDWRSGSADIYAQRVNSSGTVLWATDGVPIRTVADLYPAEEFPQLVSDGASGAIITWWDWRSGNPDIYAQRVDASGTVLWTTDGVPISTATGGQWSPQPVSDGAGGAIITWEDERSGSADIYTQRVDASGTVRWTTNGTPICTTAYNLRYPQLVNDGAGGAIITWHENDYSAFIYAQRVDASGTALWITDGVPIAVAAGSDFHQLVRDGTGGAIITWHDARGDSADIYARRVDASGTVLWTSDGVPISTATGDQWSPKLARDGAGGAIITWEDWRNGNGDIYAQKVNADGTLGEIQQPKTLRVPADYSTIQAGIDAALDGDTVLVADGTYTGDGNRDMDFKGKAIIVESENGAENTIIDCQGTEQEPHRGFYFHSGEGESSVVDGFTITNGIGLYEGGGIYCHDSSPTIKNNIIRGNIAFSAAEGGGIACLNSSPIITNNTIIGNNGDVSGGGIVCSGGSPIITNNTITGNSAYQGGGIACYNNSSPKIINNTITGNEAFEGSGIYCIDSSPTITNNTITGNLAEFGAGIGCYGNSHPAITNNTIISNSAITSGGGVCCYDNSHPTITNNTITGNSTETAVGYGGGICCYSNSYPTITNNTITDNWAFQGGGIYCGYDSSPTVLNTILWNNSPQEIYLDIDSSCSITIDYSDVEGGEEGIGGSGTVNWGEHNIDADPLFVNPDNGDYHLQAGSPCIDAGTPDGAPPDDIEGNPRDDKPDMGAYEYGSAPEANIDLSISDADISVSPSDFPPGMMNITVQIHNVGSVDVQNIVVRFLDENLSTGQTDTIDEQTIEQLDAFKSTELTALWQPLMENHKLHVIIDPDDQIEEDREDNNIATKTLDLNKPFIESVRAEYDGNPNPDVIGTFISDVEAINTFTAEVTDPDGDDDVAFVTFTLGENVQTDDNPDDGWTASFDMGELSGDEILSVKAYDKSGVASLEKLFIVHVIPIPSWLIDAVGLLGIQTTFEDGYYTLRANIPDPPIEYGYTISDAVLLLGGLENMFEAGFTFGIWFHVDGSSKLIAEGTLKGAVLGKSAEGYLEIVGMLNPDLSFAGATGTLELRMDVFTIPEVGTTIPVTVGGVPININLKMGGAIDASVNGDATIDEQLAITEASITPGVGIRVDLTAEIEILFGVASVAFIGHPTATIAFTITYTDESGVSGSVSGTFGIPYELTGSIFFGALEGTLYEGQLGPWDFETGALVSLPNWFVRPSTLDLPDILVQPHLTTDGAGNAMLVWVQDEDDAPNSVDPEIYYAFWDGMDWSEPAPIRDTEYFENNPVVTFDNSGNALALWTCNPADRSLGDTGTLAEILSHQEICFSEWDKVSQTWSEPIFLTNDTIADGMATIAADDTGNALALWVRDLDSSPETLSDWELAYSTWNGANWSAPQTLPSTSDLSADCSVTVAYSPTGDAIAAWVRDADANFETPEDTEIYYSEWDGTSWTPPAPVTLNDEAERTPNITFAPDGTAVLTWGSDLIIPKLPKSPQTSEVYELERIYVAIKQPAGIWTSPNIVTESPEMAESPTVNVDSRGIAMVVWRGYDGYDGDLFYAMSDVNLGNWTVPRTLTDDDASSWLATTAIDSDNNALTIWASQSFGDEVAQSDGVALAPMNPQLRFAAKGIKPNLSLGDVLNRSVRPIKPDLTADTDDITFSNTTPPVGESVTISATIHNRGDVESEPTVVRFFDGDPDAGGIQIGTDQALNALAADGAQDVSVDWTATAGEHQFFVQIDPDDLVDEFKEDNNIAFNSILIAPDVSITEEDIVFSDENPVLGNIVTISATVHNIGGADVTDVAVRFYNGNPDDGGVQIGDDKIIATIPIGGAEIASVDWTSTIGAHEIFVVLDPDESITEWDEENNCAFALIKVLPDLAISASDISLTVPNPEVPNGVEISVTVHNLGGVDAENVNVVFYQGDPLAGAPLIDSKTIPAITAGSSERTSISWTAPAGTSDVYVKVDEAKELDERDEANNTAFNSITIILKPDLSLTTEDISLDAEFPFAGKPTIITANVHNRSDGALSPSGVVGVLVSFYDGDPEAGGILIGSDLIPTIDASATGVATVEWDTTDKVGEHTIYVLVDEQEKIDELDETNNIAQKLVEVVTCGDLSGDGQSTAYDAALILQSVVGLEDLTPAQIAAADTSGNGSVSALDAALVLQKSVGIISEYPALEPTQVTPMLAKTGFSHSGEIQIGDSSAKPGQVVSVPIVLRGNGILAVGMVLNYDDELLEFQGLDRKLAKTEFSHSNGRLQIAVAGDADLSEGELMFVNFRLKDSVSLINEIPLTFTKAEVNEGNFAVRLKSGLISILPDKYRLLQNYPNPFNPDTWIPYQLPEDSDVLIKIYNVRGELVRTLALGVQPAGNYVQPKKAAYWDGMNDAGEQVASAVYFYTLQAGNFTTTRKMVILK